MNKIDVCYHHTDADGWCSAAIVDAPKNIRLGYNTRITVSDIMNECSGKHVAMVDFSLPIEKMRSIKEVAKSFTWIDHHETASGCQELELPGIFSTEKAGCALTWDYFHPDEPYPDAVKYVADRDIWVFEYGKETEYYCYGLGITNGADDPQSPLWKKIIKDNEFTKTLMDAGEIVDRVVGENVTWNARLNLFRSGKIFIINATTNVSELASAILDDYGKDECLVIVWQFAKKGLRFSFRGKGAKEMAEDFGKKYGTRGGGHATAAGCSIPLDHPGVWDALKSMYEFANAA